MRTDLKIGLVVAALVGIFGAGMIVWNSKSPAELRQESQSYQPMCDHKLMNPGDTCMVYDNRGGGTYTYESAVADHTPEKLAESRAHARRNGLWFILGGVLLGVWVGVNIWLDARKRRRTAEVPQP